eukprot:14085029-Ditylum_brightwellii.AAC.1
MMLHPGTINISFITAETSASMIRIYGSKSSVIKGNMIRAGFKQVVSNYVEVQNSILDMTNSILFLADVVSINKLLFMLSLSKK